jgi:hypothetical protein
MFLLFLIAKPPNGKQLPLLLGLLSLLPIVFLVIVFLIFLVFTDRPFHYLHASFEGS